MLSKEVQDLILDNLRELDFTYNEWENTNLKVIRFQERKKVKDAEITVNFFPITGGINKSISNAIGWKKKGKYIQYGYCQQELVEILAQSTEYIKQYNIHGRDYAYFLINKVLTQVLKNWHNLLRPHGISLSTQTNDIVIYDESFVDRMSQKRLYRYRIDLTLKTQFNWDHAPEEEENDGVIKEISFGIQDNKDYIIVSDK